MSEPPTSSRGSSRARRSVPLLALALLLGACRAGPAASVAASEPEASASRSMAASGTPSPETPTPTPADARVASGVAFVRPVDGLDQLFVIDPDGSERQVSGRMPHARVGAAQPLWSPDRSMIAFGPPTVGVGLDADLWIVNADGSGQRSLAVLGEFTDWSPDSSRLVWTDSVLTTDTTGDPARLWVGEVASGEVRQLGLIGYDTRWLPDGERISYVPYEPPREPRVVVTPVDGGRTRDLVEGAGVRWAPDGGSFVFEREDGVYLADADGGDVRLLLESRAAPVWSPDGSRLAFVDNDESGTFVVGVATLDGEIVWEGSPGIDPAWSPDGGHLVVDLTIGEPLIGILDAGTGERVWMFEGRYPDW